MYYKQRERERERRTENNNNNKQKGEGKKIEKSIVLLLGWCDELWVRVRYGYLSAVYILGFLIKFKHIILVILTCSNTSR